MESKFDMEIEDKECPVCCYTYNKRRVKVKCNNEDCGYEICLVCYRKYILTLEEEPKCMNCNMSVDTDEVFDLTPKTFHTDFRNHLSNLDFYKQKSMLAATQPIVEKIIEKEELDEKIRKQRDLIREMKNELDKMTFESSILENKILSGKFKDENVNSFIYPCPNDGCKAFLNKKWNCRICKVSVCSHCRAIKKEDTEHVCNEDDVKSTEYIKSKSKPCPNVECGVRIVKTYGCDHMFCVVCHEGFSWKTGRKLKENQNTNPHYYEWVRKNNNGVVPRNPAERNDRLMNMRMFNYLLDDLNNSKIIQPKISTDLYNFYTNLNHIRYTILPDYQTNDYSDNEDLRIDYIRNKINDDEFKKILKKRRKKKDISLDIYAVIDSFVNVVIDEFVKIENCNKDKEQINNSYNTMLNIINESEELIIEIKKKYGSRMKLSILDEMNSSRFAPRYSTSFGRYY